MTLLAGGLGFAIALAVQGWYARHSIAKARAGYRPMFRTPEGK
jgi:hypothetical protein